MRAWSERGDATLSALASVRYHDIRPNSVPRDKLAFVERDGAAWFSTLTGAMIGGSQFKGASIRGFVCTRDELVVGFPERTDTPPVDESRIVAVLEDEDAWRPTILRRNSDDDWADDLGRVQTFTKWHCSLGELCAKFEAGI